MLKLYNTLTKKKEEFIPIDKKNNIVKIYTCGPTVYNYAHIGNMRAYIFMDTLRKVLKMNGYKIEHVMNITDVGHLTSDADEGEDKMEKSAKEQNKTVYEIAEKYTKLFLEDIQKLNIERPEHIVKATDHIKEMEEYVKKIVKNGYGYETSKGIYFDTSKLKTYGELSKINLEGQKAGARVDVDTEKRNPLDFALWIKAPKEHIMKWDSSFGVCYPGWHIECSAMSNKYLGEKFDIHTGGVDHIPIHHENEIAQSRGANGINPANYWLHVEFLLINNGKMSKSLGNVYKIKDSYVSDEVILNFKNKFEDALNDNINMPVAVACAFEAAKYEVKSNKIYELLKEFDKVLSIDIDRNVEEETLELPSDISEILEERKIARENKDFEKSDKLRDLLKEKGYIVKDSKDGQKIERV